MAFRLFGTRNGTRDRSMGCWGEATQLAQEHTGAKASVRKNDSGP